MRPLLAGLGVVGVALACYRPSAPTTRAAAPLGAIAPTGESAQLEAGRRVARTLCATCHTEQPPPGKAPPLSMVAMHYRAAATDSADAVARIAAWVSAPAAERSLLPAMAIERFGLMPPLALPDSQRQAVAVYVLSLRPAGMHGHAMPHPMRPPAPREQMKSKP